MRPLASLLALAFVALAAFAGCGGGSSGTSSGESAANPSGGGEQASSSNLVRPYPGVAVPSQSEGCQPRNQTGSGPTTIPVKVGTVGKGASVVANVCVEGKGPFPFIVDTGSSRTVVSSRLAGELGLAKAGAPAEGTEGECTYLYRKVKLPAWTMAGLPLEGQAALAVGGPLYEGDEQLDGSIGADVLSRFGAVRIDFVNETMTVVRKEGAAPQGGAAKPSTKPLPKSLLKAKPTILAPMSVSNDAGSIGQRVAIAFKEGGGARPWSVATGSWISYVDPEITKQVGLPLTGKAVEERTYCATPAILTVNGEWTLAGEPLPSQPIGSTPFVSLHGAGGLLGAGTMRDYRSVVIDWEGGRFLLGAG